MGSKQEMHEGLRERIESRMKYKRVVVTRRGGPETLQVVEDDLRSPGAGEARVKVLATPVCAPDITARYGQGPFAPKIPFTPGYTIIGVVDALGRSGRRSRPGGARAAIGDRVAAMITHGGYSEYVYLAQEQLIPVPADLDPVEAAPLVMNYLVAYQILYRTARVRPADKIMIIGASGGIGTAFLQLGKLAGLKMYGLASKSKHPVLCEYGAIPIDYRSQDFIQFIRRAEPNGLDAVFDGMAGDYFKRSFSLLKQGGILVGYGNPMSYTGTFRVLGLALWFNLLPGGKSARYYSTGKSYLDRRPFLEDWATLFRLLEEGKIKPIIAARFPLLEAAEANEMLESGQVVGNVVLVTSHFEPSAAEHTTNN
jgi:NADPH:quinone reductase-like Zn-dependent oxidoreductase